VKQIPSAWARCLGVADRRANRLATHDAAQGVPAHEPLDGAARHSPSFSRQLPPHLVSPADLQVGSPHALELPHQRFVAPHTARGRLTFAPWTSPQNEQANA
jgi:hypothetical protein